MSIKLTYLVRNELTLIKLKMSPLSREIGFPDRGRIIKFGSEGKEVGLHYLVVASEPQKCILNYRFTGMA